MQRHVMRHRGPHGGWNTRTHVTPTGETWNRTQDEAITEAMNTVARAGGGTVVIHGISDAITDRRTVPTQRDREEGTGP